MRVFGTVVNTAAIIAGSLLGFLLKGGIPQRYKDALIQAVGLAVVLVGLRSAFASDALLLVIISMVVGTLIGQFCEIEARLDALGQWTQKKFARSGGDDLARGFVTASLVFCVGSMAIVGAMQSGLTGNHQTLYAKSILDGITAIVFASSLGIGVVFSAGAVFVYQGALTMGATLIRPLLTPVVIDQMSTVGGLLIVGIGLSLLEIRRLRVGNMLPAVFIPLIVFAFRRLFGI